MGLFFRPSHHENLELTRILQAVCACHLSRYDPMTCVNIQGGWYNGVVGDLERDAIRLLAQTEGILLDPVYSGRAFGAMTSLISQKQFAKNDKLLFWHTGGTPALFPYAGSLMPAGPGKV